MGELINEINEIKQLMRNRMDGTIDQEDYVAMLDGYNEIGKRYKQMLTLWALCMKYGIPVNKGIAGQLVGSGKLKSPPRLYDRTKNRGKKEA